MSAPGADVDQRLAGLNCCVRRRCPVLPRRRRTQPDLLRLPRRARTRLRIVGSALKCLSERSRATEPVSVYPAASRKATRLIEPDASRTQTTPGTRIRADGWRSCPARSRRQRFRTPSVSGKGIIARSNSSPNPFSTPGHLRTLHRQPPDDGTADHNCSRAEGQCLQDVSSAADTSVHVNFCPSRDAVNHFRERR